MKHVRITAAILVVLAILPLTVVLAWAGTETALPVEYPTCYQQTDKRWADKELIGPNGCGLISLVNAVHYITGNFIDPVPLAIYAHEIDAYNGSVGGGTARWVLYGNLKNYEEKYGFRVDNAGKDAGVTNKAFIEHLKQGGVAICHVYGHFIAIMDYDPQNNTYLVYDCAANPQKRFSYPRATWLTQAQLTKSQYMTVDWWCLLSATKVARNSFDGGTSAINREATGTVCARAGEKVSLSGTVSHTDGVESVYCTVDYDFSKEYPLQAEKTEDGVRYTGSLETENTWCALRHAPQKADFRTLRRSACVWMTARVDMMRRQDVCMSICRDMRGRAMSMRRPAKVRCMRRIFARSPEPACHWDVLIYRVTRQ